ncbi:STAS domain-containing protein [Facilibium subflavum]|uniref:STAS domain-containing protein n=1 Tax=Facilibium subflavum TaxID=2219058 RepID=UPI000E64AC5B|nr:STAS domain-containing protein [Facilibium subflavum]
MSNLQIKSNEQWEIHGQLSFKTTAAVEAESTHARKKWQNQVSICFKNMDHIDSAGIAWILENIVTCQQNDIKLQLKDLPSKQLNSLARIHGVDKLLNKFTV